MMTHPSANGNSQHAVGAMIRGADDYLRLRDLTDGLDPNTLTQIRRAHGNEVIHVKRLADLLGLLERGCL